MKKYLPIAFLLIVLLLLVLRCNGKNKDMLMSVFNMNAKTEEEITDELIIALFVDNIRNDILNFYSEYYSGEIEIYNYEIVILETEKVENDLICITFGVTPQIGAHNPLGYDELAYAVDVVGNKMPTQYQHIKSFAVPEKYEQYIIKPIE